jgi:hypothetical protein
MDGAPEECGQKKRKTAAENLWVGHPPMKRVMDGEPEEWGKKKDKDFMGGPPAHNHLFIKPYHEFSINHTKTIS